MAGKFFHVLKLRGTGMQSVREKPCFAVWCGSSGDDAVRPATLPAMELPWQVRAQTLSLGTRVRRLQRLFGSSPYSN
jgi:hypothetical protein